MIRIAVDAMGGDHAPSAIVDCAVAAARHSMCGLRRWVRRRWCGGRSRLGDELRGTFSSQMGYLLSRRAFRRFRRRVDYSEHGGALPLDVASLAVVAHGRWSAKAIRNAIAMAYRFAARDLVSGLGQEIALASVPRR